MRDRSFEPAVYDEAASVRRLSPAGPSVIWGALMAAALTGAGVTVWRGAAPEEKLVAADGAVRRDMARLSAERDQLAVRLAALERGFGEFKLALRDTGPETTGSIGRPAVAAQPRARFGLSLGMEASPDAVRKRWTTLAARYPAQLASLAPRVLRGGDRGQLFDLVAGPFQNRGDADLACGALTEQGVKCDTTEYAGDPIGQAAR